MAKNDTNQCTFSGNLVKDAVLRSGKNGTPFLTGSLAVGRSWKVNNEQKEDVTFIDWMISGKRAEALAKHLTKGRALILTGEMRQRRWEDQNGQKRSGYTLHVENLTFQSGQKGAADGNAPYQDIPQKSIDVGGPETFVDDNIPF